MTKHITDNALYLRADVNAMSNKRNLVLYLDKELVAKSKSLGFNLSKTFENHLKHLMTQFSKCNSVNNVNFTRNGIGNMGLPGFEPGSRTPEAHSLDQASRQPLSLHFWLYSVERS
jgi:hypothetical protein